MTKDLALVMQLDWALIVFNMNNYHQNLQQIVYPSGEQMKEFEESYNMLMIEQRRHLEKNLIEKIKDDEYKKTILENQYKYK